MPTIPTKGMTRAYESLKDRADWRRIGGFVLTHTEARSWELDHYGEPLMAIDYRGRCVVYTQDGSFSASDRDAVNSLGLLVLGWKPLPTNDDYIRARKEGLDEPMHASIVTLRPRNIYGDRHDTASDGGPADD